MNSIRSSAASRVVAVGYSIVAVGATITFINTLTNIVPVLSQYRNPNWVLFDYVMGSLMPAFVAIVAMSTWLFLGGLLQRFDARRVRWGVVGFALQTLFLASVSLAFILVLIFTSSNGVNSWYITAQSVEVTGGLLATAGFIAMAVAIGRSVEAADIGDSPDGEGESDVEDGDDWEPVIPEMPASPVE